VAEARVLDLFAGTGALGIEALSRGAASAVFVDSGPPAVRTITDNLRRAGLGDRARVLRRDVYRFLREEPGPFDLVLADPPYAHSGAEVGRVLDELAGQGLVAGGGTVVVTRPKRNATIVIPVHWATERRLEYGDSAVLMLTIP
jgi:16S rRNA (guanine966-N2)-methyltransferase